MYKYVNRIENNKMYKWVFILVCVRWRLHFEFTIESTDCKKSQTDNTSASVPAKLHTESMLWDLPIHVVATNPIQASLMMQADSSETIILDDS